MTTTQSPYVVKEVTTATKGLIATKYWITGAKS